MMSRTCLLLLLLAFPACPPAVAQPPWCSGTDYFTTSVDAGVITVLHHNALYNCCPDSFGYVITQEDFLITVVESEIVSFPCPCLCCFDIPVPIGPVAPGMYQIDFSWYDELYGLSHELLEVEVPAGARADGGLIAGFDRFDVTVPPPECNEDPPAGIDPGARFPEGGSAVHLRLEIRPNPITSSARVEYELSESGPVFVAIYGPGGARVRSLAEGTARAGRHALVWDGRDDRGIRLPAGVYCLKLRAGGQVVSRTVVLIE